MVYIYTSIKNCIDIVIQEHVQHASHIGHTKYLISMRIWFRSKKSCNM